MFLFLALRAVPLFKKTTRCSSNVVGSPATKLTEFGVTSGSHVLLWPVATQHVTPSHSGTLKTVEQLTCFVEVTFTWWTRYFFYYFHICSSFHCRKLLFIMFYNYGLYGILCWIEYKTKAMPATTYFHHIFWPVRTVHKPDAAHWNLSIFLILRTLIQGPLKLLKYHWPPCNPGKSPWTSFSKFTMNFRWSCRFQRRFTEATPASFAFKSDNAWVVWQLIWAANPIQSNASHIVYGWPVWLQHAISHGKVHVHAGYV